MPMSEPIRVATRRSPLALAQSSLVAERITAITGRPVELVHTVTQGDLDSSPLTSIGGAGVFVAAVRQAVIDGHADVAVHSLKDLPTAACEGIVVAAVPEREDPRDALCSHGASLAELPAGARIGTGSPRRGAQLNIRRPDCQVVDLRGNVDTRLAHLDSDLDAVLLAAAGLRRLGRTGAVTEYLDPEVVLPAPGQGALAVEVRSDDEELNVALAQLDDAATRAAVTAERSLLAALDAGCSAPVGAYAEVTEPGFWAPEIFLRGGVFADAKAVRMSVTGPVAAAEELGRELADQLLASGAAGLLSESSL